MTSNYSGRRYSAKAAAIAAAISTTTVVSWVLVNVTAAHAYSDRVNDSCKDDYFAHCSQHAPNSSALRYCFEASRGKLAQRCIDALVDAGEVPRKYLNKDGRK